MTILIEKQLKDECLLIQRYLKRLESIFAFMILLFSCKFCSKVYTTE